MKPGRAVSVLRWSIIGVLLFPPPGSAELTVIHDSGDTRPLAPLFEVFAFDEAPVQRPEPHRPNPGAADLDGLFPIQSPGLTPGKVEHRHLDLQFARPLFLVGADPVSRRWLKTHRERFLEIGAVGMLVQAETVADLRAIAELAGGLPVMPASASDIAEALGLSHYPVLISNQGVEQ